MRVARSVSPITDRCGGANYQLEENARPNYHARSWHKETRYEHGKNFGLRRGRIHPPAFGCRRAPGATAQPGRPAPL